MAEIFDGLEDQAHKLTTWEIDRLAEWKAIWERGGKLTERQLEILEQMWGKI